MNLHVNGRGKLSAEVSSVDFDGCTIRLDDERRPAFWAQVRLTFGQLEELLAEVRGDQAYTVAEA